MSISLLGLLFLAGCNTPKQSGLALYMPEFNYEKEVADTVQAVEQADFFELSEEKDRSAQLMDTVVVVDSLDNAIEELDYDTDYNGETEAADIVTLSDTLAVEEKSTEQTFLEKTVEQTTEQIDKIKEDKVVFSEADSAFLLANSDTTDIAFEKSDTVVWVEEVKEANIVLEQTDTVLVTTDVAVLTENTVKTDEITDLPERKEKSYYQNADREVELVVKKQTDSLPASDRQTELEKTLSNSAVRDSQQWQPSPPSRVQIQSGDRYLTSAIQTQRNYLPHSSYSTQTQTSVPLDNKETALLRARVSELTQQNRQLQNTLYDIQNTLTERQALSDQSSQSSNEHIISDISNKLEVITELITVNAANQAQVRDTISKDIMPDSVLNASLLGDSILTAEITTLQDSIELLQSYISLKNKALNSLEGKISAQKNTDSIFVTAYYNAGKIISTKEKEILSELIQKIADKKVHKISLLGFTDSSGSPQLNLRLSNQRVVRWVDELTKIGIDRELIYLQYFGAEYASEKVVHNERRVEIIVEIEK